MGKPREHAVRFSSKGQVVIPLWLRKLFHVEEGTRALVEATEEGILLKPITAANIDRAFGLFKRKGFAKEWADHKRQELSLEEPGDGRRSR